MTFSNIKIELTENDIISIIKEIITAKGFNKRITEITEVSFPKDNSLFISCKIRIMGKNKIITITLKDFSVSNNELLLTIDDMNKAIYKMAAKIMVTCNKTIQKVITRNKNNLCINLREITNLIPQLEDVRISHFAVKNNKLVIELCNTTINFSYFPPSI